MAEAGYRGEKVVLLSASDRPVYSQVSFVARDLFSEAWSDRGFPVDGLGFGGHAADQSEPDGQGRLERLHYRLGWRHRANPGGNFALRGNGQKAWFGWPTDEKLEQLRDAWFDAPDLASQKALAEQIQLRGLETLPYIPLGQMFQPTAFRSDIKDIVKAMFPLFWGVRRG